MSVQSSSRIHIIIFYSCFCPSLTPFILCFSESLDTKFRSKRRDRLSIINDDVHVFRQKLTCFGSVGGKAWESPCLCLGYCFAETRKDDIKYFRRRLRTSATKNRSLVSGQQLSLRSLVFQEECNADRNRHQHKQRDDDVIRVFLSFESVDYFFVSTSDLASDSVVFAHR